MSELNSGNTTNLLTEIPAIKLYSVKEITLATFFGGILAGGYLMAENFKAVNNTEKATITWVFTFFLIALLVISLFIPALDKIPAIVYSAFFTILAGSSARKYQSGFIEDHINAGGSYHATGRVVVITIISVLIILSLALGAWLMMDAYK